MAESDILDFAQQNYQDKVNFRKTQHEENLDLIDDLANETEVSKENLKSIVQAHRLKQKKENKSFQQSQKEKRKAFRQQIKSEVKSSYPDKDV